MLLPDTDLGDALGIAEQIGTNVERTIIPSADGIDTTTTISIGVSSEIPVQDSSVAEFIRADKAVYAAKDAGRNTVRFQTKADPN